MKDRTNKKLLLGFLLSVALCAVIWFVDITMLLFALGVPFFCLELLLLRVSKKWSVRLIPAIPIALLLLAAGYYALFGSGWDALAALIFSLMAISPAVGCVLAVIVHLFSGKRLPQKWLISLFVLLGCTGAWWGQTYSLGYWDRAFIKALSFGVCMGVYALLATPFHAKADLPPPKGEPGSVFQRPDRDSTKLSLLLAAGVFLFLTVGYMVLSPWLDLSAIPEKLRYSDITAETFPAVAAYIILCNSLLEELFFRGFAFLTLRRHAGERFAYAFSGVTFALYHVSIMDGWFHPIWFGVFIVGLAMAGMLFDWLDRRGSLWCGWLVHASANLAINLIGMRMFGIL